MKISSTLIAVTSSLLFSILAFQNCSPGFQVSSEMLASEAAAAAIPELDLSANPELTNSVDVTMAFKVSGVPSTMNLMMTCQLGELPVQDCNAKSITFSALADGDYVFKVSVETPRGNKASGSRVFRKDSTKPVLAISSTPAVLTNQVNTSFVFTATDSLSGVDKIQCAMDAAVLANCVSPAALNGLPAGAHTYKIQVTDKAGNLSELYSYSWTVDLTVPTVVISANPLPVTNLAAASFTFAGTGIVTYECELDGAGYSACASPKAYAALAEGNHTFRVRGTSGAGNVSAAAQYAWMVDLTPPTAPAITTNVLAFDASTSAAFSFTSTDVRSGVKDYQCSIDGGGFTACASPKNYAGLASGAHSFSVKATDVAGNASTATAFSWVIDVTPPTKPVLSTAVLSVTNSTTASFSFSSTDAGSGLKEYQCALDTSGFSTCTSPKAYSNLASGEHTFSVKAFDNAGNVSSVTSFSWMVDVTAPTPPQIAASILAVTADTSASFNFVSTDAGSGVASYQCALDAAALSACTSPVAYAGLSVGAHTFKVHAVDNAGNASTTSNFNWTIDTAGPLIALTTKPSALHLAEVSRFAFTVTDTAGLDTVKCRWTSPLLGLRENLLTDCSSLAVSYELSPGRYGFEIEAADKVGNKSTFVYRWEVEDGIGTPLLLTKIVGHQDGLCGIDSSGEVVCSSYYSEIPRVIPGLAGAKQLSASYHLCAVTAADKVRCGLPGLSNFANANEVEVPNLSNVVKVAAGTSAHCAILADGTARCWGPNFDGQLGDGTKVDAVNPVVVVGVTGATSIYASYNTMCAIVTGGAVKCWGVGTSGQLGNGTNNSSSTPVPVTGITGAKQIIAGGVSCALLTDGTVKCWGSSSSGALGNGSTISSNVPVTVSGGFKFSSIASDGSRVCGVALDGSYLCWGELSGVGYGRPVNVPTDLGGTKDFASVSGAGKICATQTNGTTRCMFYNWNGGLSSNSATYSSQPARSPYVRNVASLASTGMSTCALTTDKTVNCWGYNENGQLGDGTTVQSQLPVPVIGLTGIKKVVGSQTSFCALTATNTVKCWGYNFWGALGNGEERNQSAVPVDAIGLAGVQSISGGGGANCALLSDETVKCWGSRYNPVTYAYENVLVPTAVTGISGIKSISGGAVDLYSTCGVNGAGHVVCWSLQRDVPPVEIANLTDVKSVSVGGGVACALTTANGVKCWGSNVYGALGAGISNQYDNSFRASAVDVVGLASGVEKVVAHQYGVCALKQNGEVYCWGQNYGGTFGSGASMFQPTPNLAASPAGIVDILPAGRTLYFVHGDGRLSSTGQKFLSYSGLTTVIKSN